MNLSTTLPFNVLVASQNIAEKLPQEDLDRISAWCLEGYRNDDNSREEWKERNAVALKLALQVAEKKSMPWDGASNVKFPLITLAALHYHARAYPLLVDNNDLVAVRTYGADPDGKKSDRAHRLGQHMTWQNMEQMPEWEIEHDRLLLMQPILGTVYKKRWFDPVEKRQKTKTIPPDKLVCNYYSTGEVNHYRRATHVMALWPNDVRSHVVQGIWCGREDEVEEETGGEANENGEYGEQKAPPTTPMTVERDERTGIQKPADDNATPVTMLEQMCWMDLDGDDYEEPYFVTLELETGFIRRIVARFNTADVKRKNGVVMAIIPEKAYVRYGFVPAPDDSCMDIGFGHLLGPISDSVDTAINQLFDSGTMMTLGGGFLGRGARLKGGQQTFKPFEWKEVDVVGDDLRKNIVPLEVREPSNVLFQLLQFLIGYSERIVSATDTQVGENPGQNTPAETMRTMNSNGQRIYSAMFKRTWRAMRDEFRLQFDLNRTYLTYDADYEVITSTNGMVTVGDYRQPAQSVCPTADPNVTSEEDRRRKAQMTMQMSMSVPNFNRYKAIRRYLVVERIPAIDEVFPPLGVDPQTGKRMTDIPSPPQPQILLAQARMALAQARVQEVNQKAQEAQMKLRNAAMELQQQAQLIGAQVIELQARAVMEISQAKGVDQGHQIALIDSMIGAKKQHQEGLLALVKMMQEQANAIPTQPIEGEAQRVPEPSGNAPEPALGGMAGFGDDAGVFTQIKGTTPINPQPMGQG